MGTVAQSASQTPRRSGGFWPRHRDGNAAAGGPAPNTAASGEAALLELARRGSRDAFRVIVQQHQAAIFGFLRARLLEPADAEDLCQEVFLRCYTGRDRLARVEVVRPWLIGIARNVLREHVRRVAQRREVAWTELCLDLDRLVEIEPDDGDPALEHLPGCLESLGPSAREALDLRYQSNVRLIQIGEKLRRSEGAVKMLMFRARQALRNCLDHKVAAAGGDVTPSSEPRAAGDA